MSSSRPHGRIDPASGAFAPLVIVSHPVGLGNPIEACRRIQGAWAELAPAGLPRAPLFPGFVIMPLVVLLESHKRGRCCLLAFLTLALRMRREALQMGKKATPSPLDPSDDFPASRSFSVPAECRLIPDASLASKSPFGILPEKPST